MQGQKWCVLFHFHGALAADAQGRIIMPHQATLIEVSAVASNDSGALLIVGTSADDNGYCVSQEIGDAGAPAVMTQTGALITTAGATNVPNDTIVTWNLDFNGAGAAAEDVDILFTFAG